MAQRVFFDAALGQKAEAPKVAQVSPQAMTPVRTEPKRALDATEASRPNRILRPGSLLDILV